MASTPPPSTAHEPCPRRRPQSILPSLQRSYTSLLLLITFALLALAHLPRVDAALKNATIDDEFGDELTNLKPRFLPTAAGVWEGRGVWWGVESETGFEPIEFSFQFTGTAVYVFLTLAHNSGDGITTLTETNFTIDDGPPTFFRHTPDMTRTDFEYQFPAFRQENLDHRTHTLKARIDGPDYPLFINFDYAIYTVETQDHRFSIINYLFLFISF
ncbi:hypothetical protein NMY22_g8993 [Coprinellus aureogranulatus]|nr:hypothetical protein NMY22_g8993 [Coprinellus aureogranulatus]